MKVFSEALVMAVAKITCPQCKKSFKGRDDLAGKRIRCPGCGFAFVVQIALSRDVVEVDRLGINLVGESGAVPQDDDEAASAQGLCEIFVVRRGPARPDAAKQGQQTNGKWQRRERPPQTARRRCGDAPRPRMSSSS